MFGSPGSSSAIDTIFHHIPYIKDQTNVSYANVDPLIQHIHYLDIFSDHARGCTCPYQRASSELSPTAVREIVLASLEQFAEPTPPFGQFLLRCPDCPHPQHTSFPFTGFFFFL
jgi:hypothetical protein